MLDHVQCSPPEGSPPEEDYGLTRVKWWDLKICWLPRRCFLTGQSLWGRLAYRGIRYIHGPGEPVQDIYWIEKHEFLLWNLRK